MSKHVQRKGRTSSARIKRLVLVSAIVAVFALGATAAVSLRSGVTKNPAPQPDVTANGAGEARANSRSRVGAPMTLSQQTGQVRPLTQEEAQRLAASIKQLVNQSSDGLKSVQHADGSVSMDLQGRFQNAMVAKRDEDGTLTESCVDNPEAAAVFFEIDPALVGVKRDPAATKTNSTPRQKGVER